MLIIDIIVVNQNLYVLCYIFTWEKLFVIIINKQGINSDKSVFYFDRCLEDNMFLHKRGLKRVLKSGHKSVNLKICKNAR